VRQQDQHLCVHWSHPAGHYGFEDDIDRDPLLDEPEGQSL
jgi:hypothetical protein